MTISAETKPELLSVGMAGITDGRIVIVKIGVFAKAVGESGLVGFGVGAADSVKVGVTKQTRGVVAFGAVTAGAVFDVAFGQLCMPPAAGSDHTGQRTPIGAAVPKRFLGYIHALGFVTVLTETAGFVAGGAFL